MNPAFPPSKKTEAEVRECRIVSHKPDAVSARESCPHHGAVVLAEEVAAQAARFLSLGRACPGFAPLAHRVAVPVAKVDLRLAAQPDGGIRRAPRLGSEGQLGDRALCVLNGDLGDRKSTRLNSSHL